MLYEPTEIVPSTLSNTGTVASADEVNIEWQVNGNSQMAAFQIDIYENNYNSTFVYSTGRITETTGDSSALPFYGKNRSGNNVTFIFAPSTTTWASYGLTDGNSYKYKITEWYPALNNVVSFTLSQSLATNGQYYFSYTSGTTTTYYYFTIIENRLFTNRATIYYSLTNESAFVISASGEYASMSMGVTSTQPGGYSALSGTAVSSNYGYGITEQNSFSAIITRTMPTLSVDTFTMPVATATQDFTATYAQAQGDNIKWVQWEMALVEGTAVDETSLLDDTGEIYTPVLEYSYVGLENENSYAVRCTVETENGVQVTTGWVTFSVSYTQNSYDGTFTAACVKSEDCNLVQWEPLSVIPGESNGEYTVENGQLTLPAGSSVSWSEKDGEPLSASAPWSIAWSGNQQPIEYEGSLNEHVYYTITRVACLSPLGNILLIGQSQTNAGTAIGHLSLYSATETGFDYVKDITDYDFGWNPYIFSISINSTGTLAVIGTNGGAKYYNIIENDLQYGGVVYQNETIASHLNIEEVEFSPTNEDLLILYATSIASSDPNQIIVALKTETGFSTQTLIDNIEGFGDFHFNNDGTILAISHRGQEDDVYVNYIDFYSVNGVSIQFVTENKFYDGAASFAITDFRIYDNLLALLASRGDTVNNYYSLYLYNIDSNSNISFIKRVDPLSGQFTSLMFSSDGKTLLVGGAVRPGYYYDGFISCYSVENNDVVLLNTIRLYEKAYDAGDITMSNNCKFFVAVSDLGTEPINYFSWVRNLVTVDDSNITLEQRGAVINAIQNDSIIGNGVIDSSYDRLNIVLTPTELYIQLSELNHISSTISTPISYAQPDITIITMDGQQECYYLAVINGDGENFLLYLGSTPNYEPSWSNDGYQLELYATFLNGLAGGTGSSTSTGFIITRTDMTDGSLTKIATFPATITQFKDFSIRSGRSYLYHLYVFDASGGFMGAVESNNGVPTCSWFQKFSLLATEYNEDDETYHVIREYKFSCNIEDMTVSNNNSPSFSENFTPYPTRFPTTANYASGTLQALIGFVDQTSYKYWDDTALMSELNALSTTDYTLFLRDMKGRLWMVATSGAIQQTATQSTREMQVTISLPWTEIGDSSSASLVQTPSDSGWDNDAQVLDVKLDVDINTGLLRVVYPFPYNGTAFYLIGVTPDGVTSSVQRLPATASNPTDGQLTALRRS